MSWWWIPVGAAGLFIAWWLLKILLAVVVSPTVSGRAFLKRQLKQSDINVGRIPDQALDEIVEYCVRGARGIALASKISDSYGSPEDKSWRANLVRQLDVSVPTIGSILEGKPISPGDEAIYEILVRYGVVRADPSHG